MNLDLSQYQSVIDSLKPVVTDPQFDAIFSSLTGSLRGPERFQIKLELKRLAEPCTRLIDLRGLVDGQCVEFEEGNRRHYLDRLAKETFIEQSSIYGGYTIGVYEACMNTENNFRVMHKKEQRQRQTQQSPAAPEASPTSKNPLENIDEQRLLGKGIRFAQYKIRSEERMNFVTAIDVLLPNNEIVQATTSDISVSGGKIKLPVDCVVKVNDTFQLYLRGLEKEYTLTDEDSLACQIVAIEPHDNALFASYRRIFANDSNTINDFLRRFIHGNKRRYKVNLDNTIEALEIKALEQFYLPRIASLPIFVSVGDNKDYELNYALTTENNRDILAYWRDEQQVCQLKSAISIKRINKLLTQTSNEKSTNLYCFSHVSQDRVFYFSASQEELDQEPALKQLFFAFGSRKVTWRVFKLQVSRAGMDDAHIPLSIPDSSGETNKQYNKPPSPRVMSMLKTIRYVLLLTDITTETDRLALAQLSYNSKDVNNLNVYRQKKLSSSRTLSEVGLAFINLRRESRFLYQSIVDITLASGTHIRTMMRDFSVKGIQVVLDDPVDNIAAGDSILVKLTGMQKLTSKYKLERLKYDVVKVNDDKMSLHLRNRETGTSTPGKQFFRQVIDKNLSKLTKAEESSKVPGLASALRNIYCRNLLSTPWFVDRSGARYFIERIGISRNYVGFQRLLYKMGGSELNLAPFIGNRQHHDKLTHALKSIAREDHPMVSNLYVFVNNGQLSAQQAIQTRLESDFEDARQKRMFIKMACHNGLLFVLQLYLSRTGRPDLDYVNNELSYVSQYAIHRAKKIEEKIWSVVGVGDLVDVSDYAMEQAGIDATSRRKQRHGKEQFLANEASDSP